VIITSGVRSKQPFLLALGTNVFLPVLDNLLSAALISKLDLRLPSSPTIETLALGESFDIAQDFTLEENSF
jgi:hypothetical protein